MLLQLARSLVDLAAHLLLPRSCSRRSDYRPGLQPPRDIVKLCEIAIADRKDALAVDTMQNAHRQPERIGETLLQRSDIRIGTHAARAPHLTRLLLAVAARHLFNLAHVQSALDDQVGEFF